MADLTDAQRLELYKKCEAEHDKGFDPLKFGEWIAALAAAATGAAFTAAALKPFVEGFKKDGCKAILTDAQRDEMSKQQTGQANDSARPRGAGGHGAV